MKLIQGGALKNLLPGHTSLMLNTTGNMRQVLLLGSDKFLNDLIRDVFNIADFEVYKCADAATAADLIKKKKFDCFITDQKPEAFRQFNITNLLAMSCHKDKCGDIDFYCKLL